MIQATSCKAGVNIDNMDDYGMRTTSTAVVQPTDPSSRHPLVSRLLQCLVENFNVVLDLMASSIALRRVLFNRVLDDRR